MWTPTGDADPLGRRGDDAATPYVGIIADDLTGACDTAAQFVAIGRVIVPLRLAGPIEGAAVVALDADSRSRDAAAAATRVGAATRVLRSLGVRRLYKKVDSTLRGNVAAETLAVLEQTGLGAALLAPSFPALGRTVRHGDLLVDGIPVDRTPFGADPRRPVRSSRIGDILLAGLPVHSAARARLKIVAVRDPGADLARLASESGPGPIVLVADAETDDDLRALADRANKVATILPVGSGGFAAALAASGWAGNVADSSTGGLGSDGQDGRPTVARVLVLCGSLHPSSRRQIDQLCRTLGLDRRDVVRGVARRSHARTAVTPDVVVLESDRRAGDSASAASALASALGDELAGGVPEGLVVTGGDTLRLVSDTLGADAIELLGQVRIGLPWSRLVGGLARGRPIVTKAGGFGADDALLAAVRFLVGG